MSFIQRFPICIKSPVSFGGHVQGIAVDKKKGHIYLSFTTELVKCDLEGNMLGSVKGWIGHLGCIDIDEESGLIYGSLEIKNDSIGSSIKKHLKTEAVIPDSFYIAIYDGNKINEKDIDASKTDILRTSFIQECTYDYINKYHGCSGIDGTCIAPDIENNDGIFNCIYTAYGIYKNSERDLNDYQIILKYRLCEIIDKSKLFSDNPFHTIGPASFLDKYFIYTGNTNFGVQNLEYDNYTKDWLMAVYKGIKEQFPNYSYFVIDGAKKPIMKKINDDISQKMQKTLQLKDITKKRCKTPGFHFPVGQEGLYSFDNGFFYIAKSERSFDNGWYAVISLYHISYDKEGIFTKVTHE
ncbi:MAG: hypothetical protein WC332_01865 [Clostridia bacterium]